MVDCRESVAAVRDVEAGPEPRLLRAGQRACTTGPRVAAWLGERGHRPNAVYLRSVTAQLATRDAARLARRTAGGTSAHRVRPAPGRNFSLLEEVHQLRV